MGPTSIAGCDRDLIQTSRVKVSCNYHIRILKSDEYVFQDADKGFHGLVHLKLSRVNVTIAGDGAVVPFSAPQLGLL